MSEREAIDVYLNDHFAGATMAIDLIDRLQRENASRPLGDFLAELAPEIKRDRSTLIHIMGKLGIEPDPIKQAAGKVAEVVSRIKLAGGPRDAGRLLALETLSLGIEGKACLWLALDRVSAGYGALSSFDFRTLLKRAHAQREGVEEQRLEAAREILGLKATVSS